MLKNFTLDRISLVTLMVLSPLFHNEKFLEVSPLYENLIFINMLNYIK